MATLAASAFLVTLAGLLVARARHAEPEHLRFSPANEWALHHLCRVTGKILRSAAHSPLKVDLDLSQVTRLGPPTLATLEYACARWAEAGARVTIRGCSLEVAATLWRRALQAEVECTSPHVPPTIH